MANNETIFKAFYIFAIYSKKIAAQTVNYLSSSNGNETGTRQIFS